MNIWLIEPYYTGSHQAWADGYAAHSRHRVRLLTLPGRFWKWRMQGGAVTLARMAAELDERPDLILASDMLNLPVFLTLAGERLAGAPVALYFHENQLTYPLQPGEKRDLHYGFIHLASGLRANALFFNSAYHLDAFFDELPRLLKHFPDYTELWAVDALRAKARVLPLGLDLARFDPHRPAAPRTGRPLLLWNHRWEYDKDPETFFRAVYALAGEGLDFGLILLGESFRNLPAEFLRGARPAARPDRPFRLRRGPRRLRPPAVAGRHCGVHRRPRVLWRGRRRGLLLRLLPGPAPPPHLPRADPARPPRRLPLRRFRRPAGPPAQRAEPDRRNAPLLPPRPHGPLRLGADGIPL